MADDCANRCATHCAGSTPSGQNGASDSPDTCASRRVFVLSGHARTARYHQQSNEYCSYTLNTFHAKTSVGLTIYNKQVTCIPNASLSDAARIKLPANSNQENKTTCWK
jgi:hypothetical protein